jgi:hypothetical protein
VIDITEIKKMEGREGEREREREREREHVCVPKPKETVTEFEYVGHFYFLVNVCAW